MVVLAQVLAGVSFSLADPSGIAAAVTVVVSGAVLPPALAVASDVVTSPAKESRRMIMEAAVERGTPKQTVIEVTTQAEFIDAIGDFVTISMKGNIDLTDSYSPLYYGTPTGTVILNVTGLVIEGNGFSLDGGWEGISGHQR